MFMKQLAPKTLLKWFYAVALSFVKSAAGMAEVFTHLPEVFVYLLTIKDKNTLFVFLVLVEPLYCTRVVI